MEDCSFLFSRSSLYPIFLRGGTEDSSKATVHAYKVIILPKIILC